MLPRRNTPLQRSIAKVDIHCTMPPPDDHTPPSPSGSPGESRRPGKRPKNTGSKSQDGAPRKPQHDGKAPGARVPSKAPIDPLRAQAGDPALRRTVIKPAPINPDPADNAFVADRLTTLAHELSNILDGSLRCLSLARRSVDATPDHPATDLADLSRRLETVHVAMEQMAGLVKSSLRGFAPGFFSQTSLSVGCKGSLLDAVRHALDVMRPAADERSIALSSDLDPRLGDITAGPVYTIVASTIRNAIESIERLGASSPVPSCATSRGSILVRAKLALGDAKTHPHVELQIIDDGEGPPSDLENPGGTGHLFDYGVSSKPGHKGVGLAITRDVVEELGGTVDLSRRPADRCTQRSGAIVSVRFPAPARPRAAEARPEAA